jgi:hypothetical protein
MPDLRHLSDPELQALLDEALGASATRQAQEHLRVCRECARRMQTQARLFAAIETWDDALPPHDLAPRVVQQLRHRRTPLGLSLATAFQAGLAGLLLVLGWPLVEPLLSSVNPPVIPGFEPELSEALTVQAGELASAGQAALEQASASLEAWLGMAAQWMSLWPAVVAAALLLAVLGNSILLAGHGAGARRIRPRRA